MIFQCLKKLKTPCLNIQCGPRARNFWPRAPPEGGKTCWGVSTHRPLSSSFLGLPYRILNINPKRNYLGAYGYTCSLHCTSFSLKRGGLEVAAEFWGRFLWVQPDALDERAAASIFIFCHCPRGSKFIVWALSNPQPLNISTKSLYKTQVTGTKSPKA